MVETTTSPPEKSDNADIVTNSDLDAAEQNTPVQQEKFEALTPEEIKNYQSQAQKSFMWLSSFMKRWITSYLPQPMLEGDELNQFLLKKVTEKPPLKMARTFERLMSDIFPILQLAKEEPEKQATLLKKWEQIKLRIQELSDQIIMESFYELSDNLLMDNEQFIELAREFKHDILNAGIALMSGESNKFFTDPETSQHTPKIELLRKILNAFNGSYTQEAYLRTEEILRKQEADPPHPIEFTAETVMTILETLNSFNLESGGAVYSVEPSGLSIDYLKRKLNDAKQLYTFELKSEFSVDPAVREKSTYLTKSVLVRLLTNAFSNAQRVGATEVSVDVSVSADDFTVAIMDNGNGFKEVSTVPTKCHGYEISEYEIQRGKTNWENAKGTGTGLSGIQNMMQSINSELVVGNRIVEGQTAGGIVLVSAPLS